MISLRHSVESLNGNSDDGVESPVDMFRRQVKNATRRGNSSCAQKHFALFFRTGPDLPTYWGIPSPVARWVAQTALPQTLTYWSPNIWDYAACDAPEGHSIDFRGESHFSDPNPKHCLFFISDQSRAYPIDGLPPNTPR